MPVFVQAVSVSCCHIDLSLFSQLP